MTASNLNRLTPTLNDRVAIGARLRQLREEAGLTTLEVAEAALGYVGSHAAVSRLERGVLPSLRMDHLSRLAAHFNVSLAYLLGEEEAEGTQDQADEAADGSYEAADVAPGVHHRIVALRQAAGMSRLELATAMGATAGPGEKVIRDWETGKAIPRIETLLHLAATLGVSGSRLITGRYRPVTRPTTSVRTRALRMASGESRTSLGYRSDPERFESAKNALVAMENENRLPLTPGLLEKIAVALDVPVDYLKVGATNAAQFERDLGAPANAQAQKLWDEEQALSSHARDHLDLVRALMATGQLECERLLELNRFVASLCWGRRGKQLKAA